MARAGITFEQVAAAADAITGEGNQPTINGIRERLGTGSPNTVHKHLTAWRAARPQAIATAPELPASLTSAIAAEIEKAAAGARGEIETRLVQAQQEAAELAAEGETLEAENEDLLEQVAALTTERDTIAGAHGRLVAETKGLEERIEREQGAAEAARVELAKAQLKIDAGSDKLKDQAAQLDMLRATLDTESKARIAAEQAAAVLTAKLDLMQERAFKAERIAEEAEKLNRQQMNELNSANNQIQSQQIALDTASRELDDVRKQIKEARTEAKKSSEEAAELRGKINLMAQQKPESKSKKING